MSFLEEDFFEFIDTLKNEKNSIVIVEGTNDRKALKAWDIDIPIEVYRRPWVEFTEQIFEKFDKSVQIILLMDADPQGKEFHSKLRNEFEIYGYKVNSRYWMWIRRFHLTCIEGLTSPHFQELQLRYLSQKIDDKVRKN